MHIPEPVTGGRARECSNWSTGPPHLSHLTLPPPSLCTPGPLAVSGTLSLPFIQGHSSGPLCLAHSAPGSPWLAIPSLPSGPTQGLPWQPLHSLVTLLACFSSWTYNHLMLLYIHVVCIWIICLLPREPWELFVCSSLQHLIFIKWVNEWICQTRHVPVWRVSTP